MILHIANPMMASTVTMIMKITTAMITMANALNHPQSKKCLINASQMMNMMSAPIEPPTKAPTTVPITIPKTTIHSASVNLALSFPASAIPDNQRTGATIITDTMI
jgi:hypothetical protein